MKGWDPEQFSHVESVGDLTKVVTMGMRLPEPTAAELARGLAGAFDSPSMHQFDSWTDKDLYRAIAAEPEGPGHDAAVAEYVAELNARGAARAAQARLEADVSAKYGIARDGIFPADEA